MDSAAGTPPHHRPILGNLATHDQLGGLATLGQNLGGDGFQGAPALALPAQRHDDGVLGVVDQRLGGTRVAVLSAGLLAAPLAQRARRRLLERWVRGGELAGVVAVLGQAWERNGQSARWYRGNRYPGVPCLAHLPRFEGAGVSIR